MNLSWNTPKEKSMAQEWTTSYESGLQNLVTETTWVQCRNNKPGTVKKAQKQT